MIHSHDLIAILAPLFIIIVVDNNAGIGNAENHSGPPEVKYALNEWWPLDLISVLGGELRLRGRIEIR